MSSLAIDILQCDGVVGTRQVRIVTSHLMTGPTLTILSTAQEDFFPVWAPTTESSATGRIDFSNVELAESNLQLPVRFFFF